MNTLRAFMVGGGSNVEHQTVTCPPYCLIAIVTSTTDLFLGLGALQIHI
ncbi:hypothetical protein [Methyloglobulus sp.]